MGMTRKHYQGTAEILGNNGIGPWDVMTFDFIRFFEADNENHDRNKFRQAVADANNRRIKHAISS